MVAPRHLVNKDLTFQEGPNISLQIHNLKLWGNDSCKNFAEKYIQFLNLEPRVLLRDTVGSHVHLPLNKASKPYGRFLASLGLLFGSMLKDYCCPYQQLYLHITAGLEPQ